MLTVRAWWVVGIEGDRLLAAPAGDHAPRRPVDLGAGVGALLGVDAEDLAAPGAAAALAGRAWAEASGPGPDGRASWELAQPGPPRPLLLALRPSATQRGARALEGASGQRLASLTGVGDVSALLGTFETANVESLRDDALARLVRGRHVVALGAEAFVRVSALGGASSLRTAPHPSGRSLLLNSAGARTHASAQLLAAAVQARGIPHLADEREQLATYAAEVFAARPPERLGVDELRHLAAAWRAAADCGIAWPGSTPDAGWRLLEHCPVMWSRAWPGAILRVVAGGIVRATPHGDARVTTVTVEGGSRREHAEAADPLSGLLLAEAIARTSFAPSPWELRDQQLARTGVR